MEKNENGPHGPFFLTEEDRLSRKSRLQAAFIRTRNSVKSGELQQRCNRAFIGSLKNGIALGRHRISTYIYTR